MHPKASGGGRGCTRQAAREAHRRLVRGMWAPDPSIAVDNVPAALRRVEKAHPSLLAPSRASSCRRWALVPPALGNSIYHFLLAGQVGGLGDVGIGMRPRSGRGLERQLDDIYGTMPTCIRVRHPRRRPSRQSRAHHRQTSLSGTCHCQWAPRSSSSATYLYPILIFDRAARRLGRARGPHRGAAARRARACTYLYILISPKPFGRKWPFPRQKAVDGRFFG